MGVELSTATIIGICLGVFAFLLVVFGLVVLLRRTNNTDPDDAEEVSTVSLFDPDGNEINNYEEANEPE